MIFEMIISSVWAITAIIEMMWYKDSRSFVLMLAVVTIIGLILISLGWL